MNGQNTNPQGGRVVSLHLHGTEPGGLLHTVETVELVAGKGMEGDSRYFGRTSRKTGEPSRRQVSLMMCEEIGEHAATLGIESIAAGAVRANIETLGIELTKFLGQHVVIGGAVLHFYEARTPCGKMDAICNGLRSLMENGRQGVMAEVVRSGRIRVGDAIQVIAQPVIH